MNMNASQVILNTREENANISNLTESDNNINTKPSPYSPYESYVTISDDFYFYGVSVIIPCGLIGNSFSICIFLLSSILRGTSTGQYLVALAIADSTFLVGEILRWLSTHTAIDPDYYFHDSLRLNIFDYSSAACKITYFLRYGGSFLSVWLTVAIAVERLLAVAFPLKIGRISTLRTSRIVILIMAIISCSLSLFSFWDFEIRYVGSTPQCKISDDGYNIWNTVTLKFGTLIIPDGLIAILTIIIIVLLYRARNQRNSQLAAECAQSPGKGFSHSGLSTETQLTIMLLAVCIATTALRAPYTIAYYFRTQCWPPSHCDSLLNTQTYVAYRVTDVFNILNYAINFILYCLSGSSFRKQIERTIC